MCRTSRFSLYMAYKASYRLYRYRYKLYYCRNSEFFFGIPSTQFVEKNLDIDLIIAKKKH